jgi:hypothetical protein
VSLITKTKLGFSPFTLTVQDYSDRFNMVLCHAQNLSAPQKAELFVGGLPEHIKVDVERPCTWPGRSNAMPTP